MLSWAEVVQMQQQQKQTVAEVQAHDRYYYEPDCITLCVRRCFRLLILGWQQAQSLMALRPLMPQHWLLVGSGWLQLSCALCNTKQTHIHRHNDSHVTPP